MTSDELNALLETVEDEESFVRFIDALAADWELEQSLEKRAATPSYKPGAQGWKDRNIGSFLVSASAWAQAADHKIWGYTKSTNPWRRAADILIAGKHYE